MSNYVKATDFASKDALVTGDPLKIISGTEINTEFNAIQTAIATKADLASPSLAGNPTAPTQSAGNNSTRIATTAFVQTASQAAVPVGGIIMWSGAIANIPTNYQLCNGTGGTPDLRDKFIIGASSDDGGVAKSNVTGALTTSGGSKDAVVVAHDHDITDAGHTHNYSRASAPTILGATDFGVNAFFYQNTSTATSSGTTGITINSEGVSGTNQNLPPYYALAFIQRIS